MRRLLVLLTLVAAVGSALPSGAAAAGARHLRVVGGETATPGTWSFAARVTRRSAGMTGLCTGSVLAPYVVVTAAHCVVDLAVGRVAPPRELTVQVGSYDAGSSAHVLPVAGVRVHPGFDPWQIRDDVALLLLGAAADVPAVRVARQADAAAFAAGRPAAAAGWGQTATGSAAASELQSVSLPIVADEACAQAYPAGDPRVPAFSPDVMLCAGTPAGGIGTCHGDSGGPLVAQTDAGETILVGLTDWSEGCALPGKPSVFVRVAAVSDWIEQVMREPIPALDLTPPRFQAIGGIVRRGRVARLLYEAGDEVGRSAQLLTVWTPAGRRLFQRVTVHRRTSGRTTYAVLWPVPRRLQARRVAFCGAAVDDAQNVSRPSCVLLRVR